MIVFDEKFCVDTHGDEFFYGMAHSVVGVYFLCT